MKAIATGMLLAASLVAAPSFAFAQADLSPDQRQDAYDSVVKQRTPQPHRPPSFNISRGDRLPDSVQSYDFPKDMKDEGVRRYQYIVVNNQMVLIDPKTRRIIEVVK